ncbi:hypothetical protein XENOCAPTIV_019719 [Xenoophorus captivus]|uniref:Uncharacterized protein n=1 Tax=Xenoophorus captivus TaxID=1517983 RepID=A0ABV0QW14_9TELE
MSLLFFFQRTKQMKSVCSCLKSHSSTLTLKFATVLTDLLSAAYMDFWCANKNIMRQQITYADASENTSTCLFVLVPMDKNFSVSPFSFVNISPACSCFFVLLQIMNL